MQPPTRGPGSPAGNDPIVAKLKAWAKEPTLDATLSLTEELRGDSSLRAQHVDALARAVMQRLAKEPRALIELGRLQMQVGKLGEAQQSLVAAGRLDPQAAAPYRFLGEVLLRRGDAGRAERMLEKAVEIVHGGADLLADPSLDVEAWLTHARLLKTVFEQKGEAGVVAEMATVSPTELAAPKAPGVLRRSLRPPTPVESPEEDEPTQVAGIPNELRGKLKPQTSYGHQQEPAAAAPPPSSKKPSAVPPPLPKSQQPPPLPKSMPPALPSQPAPRAPEDDTLRTSLREALSHERDEADNADTAERPAARALPQLIGSAQISAEPAAGPFDPPRAAAAPPARIAASPQPAKPATAPGRIAANAKLPSFRPGGADASDDDEPLPAAPTPAAREDSPVPQPNPMATGRLRALAPNAVTLSGLSHEEPSGIAPGQPWPADRVLAALAKAGLYDPDAAVSSPAQWVARRDVARPKGRGAWLYVALGVVAIGGIGGGLYWGQAVKERHRKEAEELTTKSDENVRKGSLNTLAEAEASLGKALELDTRSVPSARIWLEDRVLRAMMWPGDSRKEGGLAGAIERGKTVGLTEQDMAFARIALALGSDDTPGAVALAKTLDPGTASTKQDAWRELSVGWVLERAGDLRAIDRYGRAAKLDPDFVPARIYLAKLAALAGDVDQVKALTASIPDDLSATRDDLISLAALSKTGVPGKPGADGRRPSGLGWIAPALVSADAKADAAERKKAAARAFAAARDPGDLVRVGRLASGAGDQALASKAALHALEVSPIFPPARVLAARLALYVGRPDDAYRALEGVQSPGDAELAALRAWLSYERGDFAGISTALDDTSLAAGALDRPDLVPIVKSLRTAQKLAGKGQGKLESADASDLASLRTLDEPGPSVAFDLAIDAADLKLAAELAKDWTDVDARPARALRLARLARLNGKADDADRYSRIAVEQGTVTQAALVERVLVLCALGKGADALALLVRNQLLAPDEQPWLRAYATAQSGRVGDAKKAIEGQADPDPKGSFAVRRDALLAFAAVAETKRGKVLAKQLLIERPTDPDVVANAKLLGVTAKDAR